jgi:Rieske 2Fe-2S family protein
MPLGATPAPIDRRLLKPSLADLREAYTLPGICYTSPELFAWEMHNFFDASWVCLGRSEGLLPAAGRKAVQAGQGSILLNRDPTGRLECFHNICRHRGHELLPVGGEANGPLIECPYHGWSYRGDGSLKSAPNLGYRPGFAVEDHGLVPVRTENWEGWLFANVSVEAVALSEHIGNLSDIMSAWAPHDLVEVSRMDYVVAANWKLVHENYQECYHCTEIHPELCRVTPPSSARNVDATGMWIGGWMELLDEAETMSLDGRRGAPLLPGLSPEQQRRVYFLGLLPNLFISAHPDYVLSTRLEPISPGVTRIECRTLFQRTTAESAGFDGSYAAEFWDVVNRQDWAAIESIQRSTASPAFRPGPISDVEESAYQFFNMIATAYIAGHPVRPRNPDVRGERVTR